MAGSIHDVAVSIAAGGALLRVAAVLAGAVRTFLQRRRLVVFRLGPIEAATLAEPPLLGVTAFLLLTDSRPADPSTLDVVAALLGAALVLYGLNLLVWALLSWRALFVGHGVLEDQTIVDSGAYALVRHPVYLGALLVWVGIATAFLSATAALLTVLFVTPVYLLYARSEEAMMAARFGTEYETYREAVPGFLPRRGKGA